MPQLEDRFLRPYKAGGSSRFAHCSIHSRASVPCHSRWHYGRGNVRVDAPFTPRSLMKMSSAPFGTPEHPPAPPPGWYQDKAHPARFHYWDGIAWRSATPGAQSKRDAHPGEASDGHRDGSREDRRMRAAAVALGCTIAFGLCTLGLFICASGGPLRWAAGATGVATLIAAVLSGALRGAGPKAPADEDDRSRRPELIRPMLFNVIVALSAALVARAFLAGEAESHPVFVLCVVVAAAASAAFVALASHYRWRRRTIAPVAAGLAILEWRWPFGRWGGAAVGHVGGAAGAASALVGIAATVAVLQAITSVTGDPTSLDGEWQMGGLKVTREIHITKPFPLFGDERWSMTSVGACSMRCAYLVTDEQSQPFVLAPVGQGRWRGTRFSLSDCATKPPTPLAFSIGK